MRTIDLNLWGLSVSRIKELEDRLLQLQAELENLKAEEEPKLPKYGQIVEVWNFEDNKRVIRHDGDRTVARDVREWNNWRPLQTSATRIEWSGGDPPVSVGTLVAYETRGGFGIYPISRERWKHTGGHLDIVAYWILEEE